MKRSRTTQSTPSTKRTRLRVTENITPAFIKSCETEFKSDPINVITRNAVVSVGSMLATTNSTRANQITHVFMNSLKVKNLKSTNQGHSGRCWMFAALNVFRHVMIRGLDLENFEFSQTFLYFYDKLERSNSYVQWFIDNPNEKLGGRATDYIISAYLCDGGWWTTFANLAMKYGFVPKSVMNETYQSVDSDDMNQIIKEHIDSCVSHIEKNRTSLSRAQMLTLKGLTTKRVYNTLVKFLGEPPKKFDWNFTKEDGTPGNVSGLSPISFREMVTPGMNLVDDFVTLTHMPTKEYPLHHTYEIMSTKNVQEGKNVIVYNTDIEELTKYTLKSISKGMAVWFGADVSQSFNWMYSALDDELDDHETIFGYIKNFSKGDRIRMRNIGANHAMVITGYNLGPDGNPVSWQVENSWGYYDNETPGMDGFLTMSHSWFKKNVMEIVINRNFFTPTMIRKTGGDVIQVNPWDSMAPATRVSVVNPPYNYYDIMSRRK